MSKLSLLFSCVLVSFVNVDFSSSFASASFNIVDSERLVEEGDRRMTLGSSRGGNEPGHGWGSDVKSFV